MGVFNNMRRFLFGNSKKNLNSTQSSNLEAQLNKLNSKSLPQQPQQTQSNHVSIPVNPSPINVKVVGGRRQHRRNRTHKRRNNTTRSGRRNKNTRR